MKVKTHLLIVLCIAAIGSAQAAPRRSNPIVSHMFTADASAHAWDDGRLYVYPSTDLSPPTHYNSMDGYHVFSTDDMITWKDHGEILHSRDVEWGVGSGGYMWAPDCAVKDGTYYYFFPHKNAQRQWEIGVATSKKPDSDFVLQGTVKGGTTFCDPCVFVDDDGQAYLYAVVKAKTYAAKLKDDWMEIEGEMVLQTGLEGLREGPFVFKRNGKYYLMYPDGFRNANKMRYGISDSPLGPWEHKGVFLDSTNVLTTHGSCVEYKGQWYIFYHSGDLSGGQDHNRSICFDPVYFNEDGTIQMVKQSRGVKLPTFHGDINYNRMFGTLDVGEYTTADLMKKGIQKDAISSLEIAPRYVVECFEEDQFKGKSWRFENNFIDLGLLGCDNTFSSIKVTKVKASRNLVVNGSFEQGAQQTISWWDQRNVKGLNRVLEDPAGGYYGLQYQGKWSEPNLTQKVTLRPGTDYKLSVSLKVDAGTKGQVILEALEPFDKLCRFELGSKEKSGEWVEFSTTFNCEEQRVLSLRLATSKDFDGSCYWDHVVLEAIGVNAAKTPRRSNPIVSHMFTADPSAHVWDDGRLYVYPSTDVSPPSSYGSMNGYHVFSTDDMMTWVDHGQIIHSDDVKWGRPTGGYMWAPDCAYKNGTYYYYFPHPSEANYRDSWKIGVATSTNPVSGFVDQGYIEGLEPYIDPCVFIDDDGQAYLYYGGYSQPYAVKLKDNMMEIDGKSILQQGLDGFREGAFVFKRKGIYTMIYPDSSSGGHRMQHAVSSNPMGPWEAKGVILDKTNVLTTHGSCVEFNGQWYLFYHNADLSGAKEYNRSICFDPMYFNEDGTIQLVEQTRGVKLPTFHQDINYNGFFGRLDVGEYTLADLAAKGIDNDAVSSLEVPPGYVVEGYANNRFSGRSWRFEHSFIDLGLLGCDNAFSSIKVMKAEDSGNMVLNGSFEQGVQQTIAWWDGNRATTVSLIVEKPVDGHYVLRHESNSAVRDLTQTIDLTPGRYYQLSASLKIDSGSAGYVLFDTDQFGEDCRFTLDASENAGEWKSFSALFNSGDQSRVTLHVGTSSDFRGGCYWDAITLVENKELAASDAEPLMGAFAASVYDPSIQSALGLGDRNGGYLELVPSDSYAASQGFKAKDLIRAINGVKIKDKKSLLGVFDGLPSGVAVQVSVWRNGALKTFSFQTPKTFAPQMLARWNFAEGSGSVVADSSGNGYDATVNKAAWVNGTLVFSGKTTNMELPPAVMEGVVDEITMTMWVKGDDDQPKGNTFLYAESFSGGRVMNIHLPWSGKAYLDVGNGIGYDRIDYSADDSAFKGSWNHWAFTKNVTAGTMSIYLNGKLLGSRKDKTIPIGTISKLTLGTDYKGAVDDVRFYNYELSAKEIAEVVQDAPRAN